VLGWIHIMRGNVLAAQLAFQRALAVDRTFGESHGGLAVIAVLQGQELNARTSIKRALRLDPQSMSAQYAQMLLLQSHGATEEARGILEAVLSRPLSGSDMQYRDLVAAHVKYLETTAMQRSAPQQRH
jgi:Flp pilus assembly protein TadD